MIENRGGRAGHSMHAVRLGWSARTAGRSRLSLFKFPATIFATVASGSSECAADGY